MVKYICSNFERLSPGNIWSQVVTIISVDIKDLNNDGLDDYYCSVYRATGQDIVQEIERG